MRKFLKGLLGFVVLAGLAFYFWPERSYKPYQVDAAYQAQVDAFKIPDMPSDWTWRDFKAQDETRIRWGETGNRDAAKASVIYVPGYTATLDMYGEHFDMLARRGYHVLGFDLRGQGGSQRYRDKQPEKLWVDDFSVYAQDVADWLNSLNLPQDRPLILSGSSFGGHVVTRAAGDHQMPINGLYLLAPAFRPLAGEYSFDEALKLTKISRRLGKAKHYVFGNKDWEPEGLDYTQGSDCSSNPARLYLRDAVFTRKPELRVGGATNQWGAEFFESSEYINRPEFYAKINVPVTIISADTDVYVDTQVNSEACRDYVNECREVVIPNTGHCLPQESDAVVEQLMDEYDRMFELITSSPY